MALFGFFDKSETAEDVQDMDFEAVNDTVRGGKEFKILSLKDRFVQVVADAAEFGVFPM